MMIVIVRTGPYILSRVLCSCRPVIQLSLASTLPQTRLCICWPRFDFSSMKEIINQETGCKRNDSDFQLMIFQAIFVNLVYICARALDLFCWYRPFALDLVDVVFSCFWEKPFVCISNSLSRSRT